jgi:hypothetical protein
MSKSAKKRTVAATSATAATKTAQQSQNERKPRQGESYSKQSRVIAMLRSPAGATIDAIMKATGWQQHSVRGFLAGVVRKRLNLKLSSEKVDGNRIYQSRTAMAVSPVLARDSGGWPDPYAKGNDRSCAAGP